MKTSNELLKKIKDKYGIDIEIHNKDGELIFELKQRIYEDIKEENNDKIK